MSRNRLLAMEQIRRLNEPELDVVLVTPDNLGEWLVPGHPFHPAYDDLALIHRSDYLRAYLLHHHGGGYTDVKAAQHRWRPMLDELNRDQDAWLLGYRELSLPVRRSSRAGYPPQAPAAPLAAARQRGLHRQASHAVHPGVARGGRAQARRLGSGALGFPGDVFYGGHAGYPRAVLRSSGRDLPSAVSASTTTASSRYDIVSPLSCATTSISRSRDGPRQSSNPRPQPLARSLPHRLQQVELTREGELTTSRGAFTMMGSPSCRTRARVASCRVHGTCVVI